MLIPLGKRILVKPLEEVSGILMIKNSKPTQFVVHAIGDEVTKVKVGNTVYLASYSGAEIEHNKEKFIVLEEIQILAKVEQA